MDADSLIHLEHPSDSYRVDRWLASIVEREDDLDHDHGEHR